MLPAKWGWFPNRSLSGGGEGGGAPTPQTPPAAGPVGFFLAPRLEIILLFLAVAPFLPFFFFLFRCRPSTVPSVEISFPAVVPLFTHLAHRFTSSTCRPTFRMFVLIRLLLPLFVLSIYLRVV